MNGDDWRFKGFSDTNGAYNRTLAVATPQSRAQFNASTPVNGASRIGGSPSGTNWNTTFGQNNPSSPSGTDWQKQFGSTASPSSPVASAASRTAQPFTFNLSAADDSSQLSLDPTKMNATNATAASQFYRSRLASSDLTPRDKQLYGGGSDLGFTSY